MPDNYQAVYDAVRSRFHGDFSGAVETAAREAFSMSDYHMACVAQEFVSAAHEQQRPCVLFRPSLSIDGDQWCALYGDNLQDGVAGFGKTPALAMTDFDEQWLNSQAQGAPDA